MARRKSVAPMPRQAQERARRRLEAAAQDLANGSHVLRQVTAQLATMQVTPAWEASQSETLARSAKGLRAVADELERTGREIAEDLEARGYAPAEQEERVT